MNTMPRAPNQLKSKQIAKDRRGRRGFSLMEILAVLAIMAILATLVTLSRGALVGGARKKAVMSDLRVLKTALAVYDTDNGSYPTSQQGLSALARKPATPPIPPNYPSRGYLEKQSVPVDPWGHEYVYLAPGRNGDPFEIISYGEDGRPGGTDDNADISSADL